MFVRKKKYKKLKRKYIEMKDQKLLGDIVEEELANEIGRVVKKLENLKISTNFLIEDYEDLYNNSLDYDEIMSLIHEEYTAVQASQIIENFKIIFD